jgi:hypothetical protein
MAPDKQMENKWPDGTLAPGHTLGSRWQPGQSGNPKGRPKGVTLSDALRRMLAEQAPGKSEQTYAEAIARALCKEAAKGNVLAAKEVADRTEGKPKQAVDMNIRDWRDMASAYGFTEDDVLREAKRLIESVADSSDDQSA